ALGTDASAVALHQLAHDGETQPEAAVAPRVRAVGLAEAIEDVGKELGRDPLPRVLHRDAHAVARVLQAYGDPPAGRRYRDRVRQQVPHDLLEPGGVGPYRAGARVQARLEREVTPLRHRAQALERRLHHGHGIHGRAVELELAARDARDVEEV